MFKKLKAFTLAEALIVLVIIGVIAAIALPSVNSFYEKKGYESALKKNYYILKTALDRYRVDNYFNVQGGDVSKIKNQLVPYLNVYKICPANECAGDDCPCWKNYSPLHNQKKYTDQMRYFFDGWQRVNFILNDGTLFMMGSSGNAEIPSSSGIWVDVNGYKKGPNVAGVDLYGFQLDDKGNLLPMGAKGTAYFDSKYCDESDTSEKSGLGCANKVIMQER